MNFKLSIHNSCQRMLAFFVAATVAALFMMVSMVHAAEWYVLADVPSSGDGTTLATAFKTINEGISAASAGDEVNVRQGTYNERLVIDKQLRLLGYGVYTNVVPLDVPTADVYDVEINASGTYIRGFTFFFNGTDGTRSGNGIVVGDLNGPPVTDVQIKGNGIYTGHTNTGIRTGKYADVSGLIISGNSIYGDPDSMCEGIYIHPYTGVGNVTIQDNRFVDFSYCGLSIEASNVQALDNSASNHDPLKGVYGIRFIDLTGGENFSNVIISDNNVGDFQYGISVGTSSDVGSTLTATIDSNNLLENDIGLRTGYGVSLTVMNNQIRDNTQYGMSNETDTVVIAENNWWGDATGPYHPSTNPDGLGNPVSDYVDYEPWTVNHPPELDPIGDRVINSGEYVEIIITATDPDNDNLSFEFSGRPPGAKLTEMTGTPENPAPPNIVLQWTPYHYQARSRPYECSVQITDDGTPSMSDSENFSITVVETSVNGPLIEKLGRPRRLDLDDPPHRIRMMGVNFGTGDPGDYVRIGRRELSPGHRRIVEWSPTKIIVTPPTYRYTKNGCAWFKGRESRRERVWVNIGGVDSNKKRIKVLKPTEFQ